ncbi:hypothetical protein JW905_03060, partial [bacterium]|nr:hypothetical protein [candidate division CSSED10-310 bacterium]
VVNISHFKGRLQQALGLGQSSKTLNRHYLVQIQARFIYDPAGPRPQFIPPEVATLAEGVLAAPVEVVLMDLLPKKRRIQKRVQRLHIWLNTATWLPIFIQYDEASGDTSTLYFTSIERDTPIPPEKLSRILPDDVTIRRRQGQGAIDAGGGDGAQTGEEDE